jgi:plastocyanin domain-containing protein
MINRRTLPAVVVSLLALASCKERKDAPSTGTGRPPELPTAHSHVEIAVTANGFEPAKVAVEKGAPSTLVFTRKTDATCAKEVVFKIDGAPEIRKELPLNQQVEITMTFPKAGDIQYACGMDMVTGVVSVQ